MKISKGPEGLIGQTTNSRLITMWINSHYVCSENGIGIRMFKEQRQKGRKQA